MSPGGMTRIRRSALAVLVAAGFGLLVGGISSSFQSTHAEEVQIAASFGTGSLSISDAACSAASGETTNGQPNYDQLNNQLEINVLAGSIASNCLGIKASTTGQNGYTLAIDGPDDGQLKLADQAILPVAGTLETPTSFATSGGASAWGFALPSGQIKGLTLGFDASYAVLAPSNITNTANYAAVPSEFQPISTTTAANGQAGGGAANGDHYDFFFAASAGENVPTGTYTGVVTISGYGNTATPPPDIQTFTADNCPTTRTMVRDARDDHTYWIRKIPNTRSLGGSGDLCWMETNLAYAGGVGDGGTDAYGDVIQKGTTNTTLNEISGTIANSDPCYRSYMNQVYDHPCVYVTDGSTSGYESPSESTDGGVTDPQYGYLYNWCAAMNGTNLDQHNNTGACSNSSSVQPNQQANGGSPATQFNICPAGWRLPTGEATIGEFAKLAAALGWTSGGPQDSLLANGLYMYGGGVTNGGGASGQDATGYYWSSSVNSVFDFAYFLSFSSGSVNPADSLFKNDGRAVRCVADPAPPALTTEAPTGAYMQEIVGNQTAVTDRIKYHCPTTRTMVRDARNNNTYWIRKIENTNGLGDGNGTGSAMCWMETNLAYAGGTANGGVSTYGDVINDLVEGSTANNNIDIGQACHGDVQTVDAFRVKCYWIAPGANPTSDTTDPSTSTNGAGQYGYLYSWCSAMNGQPEVCQTSVSSQPNQQVNPDNGTVYNICPAGWRLPTGEPTSGELTLLNNAINGGITSGDDPDAGLLSNGLYMYSGMFAQGSLEVEGDSGFYLSSSAAIPSNSIYTEVFVLRMDRWSNDIYPAARDGDGWGMSVRCVAP